MAVAPARVWYRGTTVRPPQVPAPSPIFVGREAELQRLEDGLRQVSVALVVGVAGVGKSAITYALAARWPKPVAYRKATREPLAVLLDDARRQLTTEALPTARDDAERILELADALDRDGALLVLDDLHHLEPATRSQLLRELGARLRSGRVLATSRERVPVGPSDPDRMELQLSGLPGPAARELWQALDELYGPADGFETALDRWRGNPFQLRRAHAGGLDDDDPLAAAVHALTPPERRLAGALGLAGRRLPTALLSRIGESAREHIRRLVTLLIVDVDGAGTCGMHDLFREALVAELTPEEAAEIHRDLAELLPEAGLDPVVFVREVAGHLTAAGDHARAGEYLCANVSRLVQAGATADAMHAFDRIPADHRSPVVRTARARCMAHLCDIPGAYAELERLVAAEVEPRREIQVVFGEVALIGGHVDAAVPVLEEVLADPDCAAGIRSQAQVMYAFALGNQGHGDAAREFLRAAEARESDPRVAANLALSRLRMLWVEERDDEAEEPMRRARTLLPTDTMPYDAVVLVPMTFASVLARQGRFAEAEPLLAQAEAIAARRLDSSSELYMRRMRANILWERGERTVALAMLRDVGDAYERAGFTLSSLLVYPWVARALMVMGRRREALRILEGAERRATDRGLGVIGRIADRTRAHDPLEQLAAPAGPEPSPEKRGEAARRRALAALRASIAGVEGEARALLAANADAARGPGYALDRAIGHLALAALARGAGKDKDVDAELERARRIAAEDEVDPDLIGTLFERVGSLRLVTGAGARVAVAAPERGDAVLDGRSHELRAGGQAVSFKTRAVLRRMLYCMAGRPGEVVSKDDLVHAVWQNQYDPLRHDNPLWVNVRRLRVLLQPTPLRIEADEGGYRLMVPPGFVYVEPPRKAV